MDKRQMTVQQGIRVLQDAIELVRSLPADDERRGPLLEGLETLLDIELDTAYVMDV